MTFLCISSIMLSPRLQAFPGSSLLPQWHVGQLPTLTGKTINDALTEHRWNYRKQLLRFGILGTLAGSLYTLAAFAVDAKYYGHHLTITYPKVAFIVGVGGIIGALLTKVLAMHSPHGRALRRGINSLNHLRHYLAPANPILTQESIDSAMQTKQQQQELHAQYQAQAAVLNVFRSIKDKETHDQALLAYADLQQRDQEQQIKEENCMEQYSSARKDITEQYEKKVFQDAEQLLYQYEKDRTDPDESSVQAETYVAYQALKQLKCHVLEDSNRLNADKNVAKENLKDVYNEDAYKPAVFSNWKRLFISCLNDMQHTFSNLPIAVACDEVRKILRQEEAQASSQSQQT